MNDFEFILQDAGKDVKINEVEKRVLLTNRTISNYEEKNIHSIEEIKRGDIVEVDNNKYLIISDTSTKRYGKYKAIMRRCNETLPLEKCEEVQIGVDPVYGTPIYDTLCSMSGSLPCIVDTNLFSVSTNQAINVPQDEIIVTIQDNESNRTVYDLASKIELYGHSWQIQGVDLTKNGIMNLHCKYN
ncbi:hypothetical protein ACQKJC_11720 [Priestia koreensis]|uniref:hypothetical protein n=1 Tax=Priestia koreensis TaxID=284581 RepID=UPI003CFCE398